MERAILHNGNIIFTRLDIFVTFVSILTENTDFCAIRHFLVEIEIFLIDIEIDLQCRTRDKWRKSRIGPLVEWSPVAILFVY